jgi:hypothetical protein
MELVIAELEGHIQVDYHAGQDTKCETKHVDGCRQLMPAWTAQGKKQLVFYHDAKRYADTMRKKGPLLKQANTPFTNIHPPR